jgi:RNA polymerase sigma-70 factor (ECF subfamily)
MDRTSARIDPDFPGVYQEHRTLVHDALRRLGVDRACLDDAAQDVFLVLYRRIEDYDRTRSLKSWLWGIARGVASGYRRSARRFCRLRAELPRPDGPPLPDEYVARRQATLVLDDFLGTLDADKCAVFVMSEVEGRTGPEIAGLLSVNLNTVYARLRAARGQFDRALARHRIRRSRRPAFAFFPLGKLAAFGTMPGLGPAIVAPAVALTVNVTVPYGDGASVGLSRPAALTPVQVTARKSPEAAKEAGEAADDVADGGEPMKGMMVVLAGSLLATPALAKPRTAKAPCEEGGSGCQDADEAAYRGTTGDTKRYVFPDEALEGEVLFPDGQIVPLRTPGAHGSLINVRAHFMPELIQLGNDV